MRRRPDTLKFIGRVDLPEELADEVRLLLLDPVTNRISYGEFRKLCYQLFSNWVDSQRQNAATTTNEKDIPPL